MLSIYIPTWVGIFGPQATSDARYNQVLPSVMAVAQDCICDCRREVNLWACFNTSGIGNFPPTK